MLAQPDDSVSFLEEGMGLSGVQLDLALMPVRAVVLDEKLRRVRQQDGNIKPPGSLRNTTSRLELPPGLRFAKDGFGCTEVLELDP